MTPSKQALSTRNEAKMARSKPQSHEQFMEDIKTSFREIEQATDAQLNANKLQKDARPTTIEKAAQVSDDS